MTVSVHAALVIGEEGAEPEVEILLPIAERVPWGGHAGRWAVPQLYEAIKANRTTLVFTNTRFLAEFIFQCLWEANEDHLPIGIHHGSLSTEARRKVEDLAPHHAELVAPADRWPDIIAAEEQLKLIEQMGLPNYIQSAVGELKGP